MLRVRAHKIVFQHYRSKADKPARAKIHLCPLLSKSGQTRVRLECPLLEVVSTDRRNTLSLTAKMECVVISQRFRRGFTAAEKTELWDRWQRGEPLKAIGRAFGKPSSSIYCQVAPHGGIRPAPRRRSRLALTASEREEISRGIAAHQSARSMARLLGRSPSTVSRELSRNGGYDRYRAALADEKAWVRSRRPKRCKLAINPWLRQAVASKLRLNWAPEQIAGWLKRAHPDGGFYRVSHETIYRSLFVQARGVLKKELLGHLRSKRTIRRSQRTDPNGDRRGQIKDLVSISQRPAAVEDRAVPGHWEGDLLSGSRNSYIATLVERHTRYVMLAKVANKDTETVISALIKQAKVLPSELYKSLTWDRGKELTDHRRFTLATNIDVYFCDPQSPWQRGSNENTNGLLRQYFPKGTDLSVHSQAYLNKVARQLNERPRETLQFETPAERFNACVASTG
jgi:IS30 family transposase